MRGPVSPIILTIQAVLQGQADEEDHSQVPGSGSHPDTQAHVCPGQAGLDSHAVTDAQGFKVKKRFPTLTHMSDVGIITDHERKIIEDIDLKCIQVQIRYISTAISSIFSFHNTVILLDGLVFFAIIFQMSSCS